MARYFLRFRHSDTGLTPTFTFFKKASDLTAQAAPSISELGSGTYYFDYAPLFDVIWEVDGGASIPTEEVRYISDTIGPRDGYVDEPTSQVKDDVWNDAVNRSVGTKGDFVEHVGIDTDAVNAPSVFGQLYKARDIVMGGTGFGGTGIDILTAQNHVMGGTGYGGTGVDVKTVNDTLNTVNTNTAPAAVATSVWDTPMASHNILGSMGQMQQHLGEGVVASGGGPSSIKLAASASALDDFYIGTLVTITSGTGAKQSRNIIAYVGATRMATVESPWVTAPVGGVDEYMIMAADHDTMTEASISSAVWNELISGHQTSGSMGRFLNDVFRLLKNKAIINPTTKQLEIYNDAGTSIVFAFDLKDDVGVASATKIFQRIPL